MASKRLAQEDLPNNGSVPMRDDQLVFPLHDGEQGTGGRSNDVHLLLGRPRDPARMDGIPPPLAMNRRPGIS